MQVEQDEVVMARGQLRARGGERAYRIELRHARVMRQRGEWRLVVGSHRAQIGAHEYAEALIVLDEQYPRDLLGPPHGGEHKQPRAAAGQTQTRACPFLQMLTNRLSCPE